MLVNLNDNIHRMTRETCCICGDIIRVGFHVPDEIWEQVVHPSRINDIHCLNCFTRRADEKLIDWDKQIRFYPVSFASHISPDFKPRLIPGEKQ